LDERSQLLGDEVEDGLGSVGGFPESDLTLCIQSFFQEVEIGAEIFELGIYRVQVSAEPLKILFFNLIIT
jgi:hypothetical protein